MIAANTLANLLARAPTYRGGSQFTLLGTYTTLSRQRQGQRLWKEDILLRPATGGQVVDNAQQQWVIRR
ncbi:hypothetical protein D3C84_1108300 [compost metagenome]